MELNPFSEMESNNEQDCSNIANSNNEEGDNSMNISNELGHTISLLIVASQKFIQNQTFKMQLAVEILGGWYK